MINVFLSNRIIVLLGLPLIIFLYHFVYQYNGANYSDNVLNLGFWGNFTLDVWQLLPILSGIVILGNALIINLMFNSNEFYDRNTYVSSLLYIVLMSFYSSFYQLDGIVLAHFFLILCLMQIFKLRQNEDGKKNVFNLALFAGIAASFHPPLLGIVPFLYIIIWTTRPFILRESILLIAGFITPLIYVWTYLYTTGNSINYSLIPFEKSINLNVIEFYVSTGLLVLSFLLGILGLRTRLAKSTIRLKKIIRVVMIYMIAGFSLGIFDILYFNQYLQFSFVMIPMGFFFPYAFLYNKLKFITHGLFYLLFAYSLLKFFV